MKLSALRINTAKFEEAQWIDDIPEVPGVRLRVRGFGNADFRRLRTRLFDAVPRNKRHRGRIDADESKRILVQCLTETVLQDWSGIEDDDGVPIPYSADTAMRLLNDPDLEALRNAVVWAADAVDEDVAANREEDAGN